MYHDHVFTEAHWHITPKGKKWTKCTVSLQNFMYTVHQRFVCKVSDKVLYTFYIKRMYQLSNLEWAGLIVMSYLIITLLHSSYWG